MQRGALGHTDAAFAAFAEALSQSPVLAQDPVRFWANFQVAPKVIDRFNAALAKVGLRVPPQGLRASG